MDNIIYGSHNTMTYLPIKNWWLFPGLLIARCQKRSYDKQFLRGARVFDLRVYFNKRNCCWEFAHGLINFKSKENIEDVIDRIFEIASYSKEDVYIRLILEKWDSEAQSRGFSELCRILEESYNSNSYMHFIGGNRKGDWKKVYTFKDDIPDSLNNQWVSSMAEDARWYEKAFPFLYAWRCNKKNKVKMKEKLNLFDFV